MPPSKLIKPHQKYAVLLDYAKRFGPKVFIETGTLRGDTIKAMLFSFDRLYTIDINEKFSAKVKYRFAGWPRVTVLNGDSGKVLPELIKTISEPCLFWLDAHFVGTKHDNYVVSAPIREELKCVLEHSCAKDHVILIDDAWYFTDEKFQPGGATVAELEAIVREHFPDWIFTVEMDIIRTHHGDGKW